MRNLCMHFLQHVPFEGPGYIEDWAIQRGHTLSFTKFFENDSLPDLKDIDWLVVMGGPMGVYEEEKYSWLQREKAFIKAAIEEGKTVVGICLGAQLIAAVLGAKVVQHKEKEIGWFPVCLTVEGRQHELFSDCETTFSVFHWHGDTFTLPEGSTHLMKSAACENQAFLYKNRVLGLQFHLEATPSVLQAMVDHCHSELQPAPYVQNAKTIIENSDNTAATNDRLRQLLDWLLEKHNSIETETARIGF